MALLDLDPNKYRLPAEEHERIFQERIIPVLFTSVSSVKKPVAIIFGGQPGSGKTAAVEHARQQLQRKGGCALIVGDELRDYNKIYTELLKVDDKTAAFYTDRDSGWWVEKAINHAKNIRCNLVIEGTMRVPEKVAETMRFLREAGFVIEARALAVNEKLSWQGVLQRYEKQKASPRACGRMTTPEAHQAGYDGMLNTLEKIEQEKLADCVGVYTRSGLLLYENHLKGDKWECAPQARHVVEQERARSWTLPERLEYAKGFDKLLTMLEAPNRGASHEEVNAIKALQQRAYQDLGLEMNNAEVLDGRHPLPESI